MKELPRERKAQVREREREDKKKLEEKLKN